MLFPVYLSCLINDLPEVADSTCQMYADDTKMYRPIRTEADSLQLQRDFENLIQWSKLWKLNLNADKYEVLHLGPKNVKHTYNKTTTNPEGCVTFESTDMEFCLERQRLSLEFESSNTLSQN